MKISSNEYKIVNKTTNNLQKINNELFENEDDDFFNLKRKKINQNLLKNIPSISSSDININYKILLTNLSEESSKQKILEFLNNNNIKYKKAEVLKESLKYNVFDLLDDKNQLKRKFLEIIFEDSEQANEAYQKLKNFEIEDCKFDILFL